VELDGKLTVGTHTFTWLRMSFRVTGYFYDFSILHMGEQAAVHVAVKTAMRFISTDST